MTKPIPPNALVVIADGAKAILLRNTATAGAPLALREQQRLTLKDFVDDGPSGARPDESPHETNEATFAKKLAKTLEKMQNHNDFAALVLIADPQTLGQLRDAMHKNLARAIEFSLAKDYTNHTTAEITAALS